MSGSLRWLVVSAGLLACTPTPAPVVDAAREPAPPVFSVAPPVEFVRDVARSEDVSGAVSRGLAKAMCKALSARDAAGIQALLTADFEGRALQGKALLLQWDASVVVARFDPAEAVLDAGGFAAAMKAHLARFSDVEGCGLKADRFRLAPGARSAWVEFDFLLRGHGATGPQTQRGRWRAAITLVDGSWRMRKVEIDAMRQVVGKTPPFADVSRQVGFAMAHDPTRERSLESLANVGLLDNLGGLAVLDHDGDGYDDIAAWNWRRTMVLFRNDGRGGFSRRSLLPAPQVGQFQLFLDLDGDAVPELLSSELTACRDGRAELSVYRRKGATYAVAGTLGFDVDCGEGRGTVFQHIAPGDFDNDGDLDLFYSGYRIDMRPGEYNRFDSHAGTENRLFINEGGLVFTEAAAARGITGTRHSYAGAWYDHDDDGDLDLYVVNDFGPNTLYLGDGAGRFTRGDGPLVANAASMGITRADFDGDGQLDLYVSNMESHAGNRIVDLVERELKPETLAQLKVLAAGNWLLLKRGAGQHEEAAARMGVAGAHWAWGQAYFDADNDGDRDLYVVNGMQSNSRIREHDF